MDRRTLATTMLALAIPWGAAAQSTYLYGRWEVRLGQQGLVFVFNPSGRYVAQKYTAINPGAAPRIIDEEQGTYTVQGGLILLTNQQGVASAMRWRIGPDITLPGRRVLYLANRNGGNEQMYYPDQK